MDVLDLSTSLPEKINVEIPGGTVVEVDTIALHETYLEAIREYRQDVVAQATEDDDKPWLTVYRRKLATEYQMDLGPIEAYKLASHILSIFKNERKNFDGSQKQSDTTTSD